MLASHDDGLWMLGRIGLCMDERISLSFPLFLRERIALFLRRVGPEVLLYDYGEEMGNLDDTAMDESKGRSLNNEIF